MGKTHFKNILLDTAVAAISCDGDIDEREIEALKNIEKSSPYFSSTDLSENLDKSLKEAISDIMQFQGNVFNKIKNTKLNLAQELTLIEISLRIIAADDKEEDSEREFIINLRNCLDISDLLLYQRFGEIEYLGLINLEDNFSEFNKPEDPIGEINPKQ